MLKGVTKMHLNVVMIWVVQMRNCVIDMGNGFGKIDEREWGEL